MALILASCSNGSTLQESDALPVTVEVSNAPSPTLLMIEDEFAWSTDESLPEGLELAFPLLLPTSAPDGALATVEVRVFTAGTQPQVNVAVRWENDGLLSLGIVRDTGVEPLDCSDLSRGGGSEEDVNTTVRDGILACEFTNEVGLYFLRWVEGGDSFHLSSRLAGDEARRYLATWTQF